MTFGDRNIGARRHMQSDYAYLSTNLGHMQTKKRTTAEMRDDKNCLVLEWTIEQCGTVIEHTQIYSNVYL